MSNSWYKAFNKQAADMAWDYLIFIYITAEAGEGGTGDGLLLFSIEMWQREERERWDGFFLW